MRSTQIPREMSQPGGPQAALFSDPTPALSTWSRGYSNALRGELAPQTSAPCAGRFHGWTYVYVCQRCGQKQPAKVPAHKLVTATREKEYPFRHQATLPLVKRSNKRVKRDDPGGYGFETVREITVCAACAAAAVP